MGPYQVVELLDAGGMGEVYRARDHRLGRDVALKVLHARPDGDAGTRLSAEARAAAAISDPNVVAVFDVGETGGVPFVVTELLEGETLRPAPAARAGATRGEAVALGIEIARGLTAVHARGFVHRDLKPDNVFLTRQGGVKLLDFGVAKALTEGPPAHGGAPGPPGTATLSTRDRHARVRRAGAARGTPDRPARRRVRAGRRAASHAGAALDRRVRPARAVAGDGAGGARAHRGPLPRARARAALPVGAEDARRALESLAARPRRALARGAAGAAAAASVAFGAVPPGAGVAASRQPAVRSLAVLPLADDAGGSGDAYLGEGIADGLAAQIVAHARAARPVAYDRDGPGRGARPTRREAARRLGVDAILAGSVRRSGQRVRIDLRLDRVATGGRLWEGTYEGALHDVPALLRTIAASLLSGIGGVPLPAVLRRAALAQERRGLRGLPARAPPLEPAVDPDGAGGDRAVQPRAPARPALRAGLHRPRGRVRDARGHAALDAAPRGLRARRGGRAAGARARSLRSRGARDARPHAHARVALGGSGARVPAGDRREPGLRAGAPLARVQPRLAGPARPGGRDHAATPSSSTRCRRSSRSDVAQVLYFAGPRRARRSRRPARRCRCTRRSPRPGASCSWPCCAPGERAEAARELGRRSRGIPDGGPGASVGYAYARLGRRTEAERTLAALQARRAGASSRRTTWR